MNPLALTLGSLIVAVIAHSAVSGLAVELFWRKTQPAWTRRAWLALATASMLLALHHGYTLELAVRTGMYDMRQAVLAGLAGILFALGFYGLRAQQA
jgi:hypothetical protein